MGELSHEVLDAAIGSVSKQLRVHAKKQVSSGRADVRASTAAKVLAVVLVAYILLDVLLTPLAGLETRPPKHLTGVGIAFLVVYGVGFLLAILSLVLVMRRSRRAPIVAIVAAALDFPALIADQTGHLSSLRPPIGIAWVELGEAIVAVLVIGISFWVLQDRASRKA